MDHPIQSFDFLGYGFRAVRFTIPAKPLDRPWCLTPRVTVSYPQIVLPEPRARRLPPLVRKVLDWLAEEDAAGQPVTTEHFYQLVLSLSSCLGPYEPAAHALLRLQLALNDQARGQIIPSPPIPDTEGAKERRTTAEVNFMDLADRAFELSKGDQLARRQLETVLRRAGKHIPDLMAHRRDLSRRTDIRAGQAALRRRKGSPFPPAVTTRADRLAWLLRTLDELAVTVPFR
jgi:hypothetical protein